MVGVGVSLEEEVAVSVGKGVGLLQPTMSKIIIQFARKVSFIVEKKGGFMTQGVVKSNRTFSSFYCVLPESGNQKCSIIFQYFGN
jgi:hypothetical protein